MVGILEAVIHARWALKTRELREEIDAHRERTVSIRHTGRRQLAVIPGGERPRGAETTSDRAAQGGAGRRSAEDPRRRGVAQVIAESYRGSVPVGQPHGLHGVWAYFWPLQIDVFIGVGELSLIVALADSWPVRSRVAAWGVTVLGLAVSVAGNVGHVTGRTTSHGGATAAVPPLRRRGRRSTVGLGTYSSASSRTRSSPARRTRALSPAELATLLGHAHEAAVELFAAEPGHREQGARAYARS